MNKAFDQFNGSSDVVVIGTDPERADYDNPRGEVYGFAAYVRAYNAYGDTRSTSVGVFNCERDANAAAEKIAAALQVRLAKLGKLPVGFAAWKVDRPVYGSEAYEAYGREDDAAWERELDAA